MPATSKNAIDWRLTAWKILRRFVRHDLCTQVVYVGEILGDFVLGISDLICLRIQSDQNNRYGRFLRIGAHEPKSSKILLPSTPCEIYESQTVLSPIYVNFDGKLTISWRLKGGLVRMGTLDDKWIKLSIVLSLTISPDSFRLDIIGAGKLQPWLGIIRSVENCPSDVKNHLGLIAPLRPQ